MQIRVLGCSGGIGGDLRTTSFLVDDDILVDAGTGVADLSLEEMARIDHIFLTHSHLDHVLSVPLLADSVIGSRHGPIVVHATRETWKALKEHIFNWKIWPDFTVLPTPEKPFVTYEEVVPGVTVNIKERKFTAIPVNHVVPAVGYQIDGGVNSLVFTGDTTVCDGLWEAINRIHNFKYLVIETAFSNHEQKLAEMSKHLCPTTLASELKKLKHPDAEIFITHLKPGEGHVSLRQIRQLVKNYQPTALSNNQIIEL
jgi:ribonuclease BN (tRNA processing enzyme)